MGLVCQLSPVLREHVSAPGTGECVESAIIGDRRAVDNELRGAGLRGNDGSECAVGGGTRWFTHKQRCSGDIDGARRKQSGSGVVIGRDESC